MIKAPFNFVPLSEEVFFPSWANDISHDIPFRESKSGMLQFKIKAITPIFVRNGHTRDDKENWTDEYITFCKAPDGRFFIPATSIKGMVRNVLEIASFGKMAHITNKRYSIRDLHLKPYTDYFKSHPVHCGWMTIKKETVTITDNGIPRRISAREIDSVLNIGLEQFIKEGNLTTLTNRFAKAKYAKAKNKSLSGHFRELPPNLKNSVDDRIRVKFDKDGEKGTIVFTGQPGKRNENPYGKSTGKWFEFVFFDEIKKTYELTKEEGGIFKDFCFIYQDSEDWKYWKTQQRIPVFFTIENDSLQYLGLSYLFKLPTKKHIKEFLNEKHLSQQRDLAECIFGTTDGQSLKGRVQFSNAFCSSPNPQECEVIKPYMGSPKPTYYPIYTQQHGNEGQMSTPDGKIVYFKTFLNEDAKLRGWKRYPVREEEEKKFEVDEQQSQNTSPFKPLAAGTEFECVIRYHNLKEEELGALVYALNISDNSLYSLGFCKPYGYGVVKLEITNMNDDEKKRMKDVFINLMNENIPNYNTTPQIRELKETMSLARNGLYAPLKYIESPKEFAKLKNQNPKKKIFGYYQQPYSQLKKKQKQANPLSTNITAEVTFIGAGLITAKSLEGKDKQPRVLKMNGIREKLKIGNKVLVRPIKEGGTIVFLFIRKI